MSEAVGLSQPYSGGEDVRPAGGEEVRLAGGEDVRPAGGEDVRPARDPRRLTRNIGALAGGQVITWTMTWIWTLVVPRALGSAGLGTIVSAQSVNGVLSILLGFGTVTYVTRQMVVNPHEGPNLVGTAIVMRLVLAPVVGAAALLWTQLADYDRQATVVLFLITAMTIFTLLTEPMQASFQALERMKYLAYTNIVSKTAQSLGGVVLVIVGFRAIGIAANMAIIAGVLLVLNALWLRRFMPIHLHTNARLMATMARESMAYWAFGLFGMIYFWIDTIMLSLMTRPEVVGWYGASSQLFQTLMFLPILMATAWLPRMVSAFTENRQRLIDTARTPLEFVLVVAIPIAASTALIARPLIHGIFGPSFSGSVPVMVVLAFCIPPIYLNIMLAQVLIAEKRQRVWTVVMGGAAVINPLMNLVLIPLTESHFNNGAIGAAISLVLTELGMDAAGIVLVGPGVFDQTAVRRCLRALAASAAMLAVAFATQPLGVAISLAAAMGTLVALVFALRIPTAAELKLIRSGLSRLRAGLRPRAPGRV